MPGDELVDDPEYLTTRAITVDAGPEDIYPWLVQMGYQRGGLYSYDFLDRLFDSSTRQAQRSSSPVAGPGAQRNPIGRGGNFPVKDLKRDEFLLLAASRGRLHLDLVHGALPDRRRSHRAWSRGTPAWAEPSIAGCHAGMDLAAHHGPLVPGAEATCRRAPAERAEAALEEAAPPGREPAGVE
jgi:hypothetical protein